jgi:hypothetical protein
MKKLEWSKGKTKVKPERKFKDETKSFWTTTSDFYSSMAIIIHQSRDVNNVSITTRTPMLGFHDPTLLHNTINPYTYRR